MSVLPSLAMAECEAFLGMRCSAAGEANGSDATSWVLLAAGENVCLPLKGGRCQNPINETLLFIIVDFKKAFRSNYDE